jgi:hypothetical protein
MPAAESVRLPAWILNCESIVSRLRFHGRIWLFGFFAAVLFAATVGCEPKAEISSYRALKQHRVDEINDGAPRDRLLGAIIPMGREVWFFKLVGRIKDLQAGEPISVKFNYLISSVTFSEGDKVEPDWTLPPGWRRTSGGRFRFATLVIDHDPEPLELSVSKLPALGGGESKMMLMNINRWRRQMKRDPIELKDLYNEIHEVSLGKTTATLVTIDGTFSDAPMRGPHAGATASQPPRRRPPPPRQAAKPVEIKHETPDGWNKADNNIFSKLAYRVTDGDQQVMITVTPMSASNDPFANINRWRGQVKLPPLSKEEFQKQIEILQVNGEEAIFMEMIGPEKATPRETILGVLAGQDINGDHPTLWFIKLKGSAALAAREKANFKRFAESIRFVEKKQGKKKQSVKQGGDDG